MVRQRVDAAVGVDRRKQRDGKRLPPAPRGGREPPVERLHVVVASQRQLRRGEARGNVAVSKVCMLRPDPHARHGNLPVLERDAGGVELIHAESAAVRPLHLGDILESARVVGVVGPHPRRHAISVEQRLRATCLAGGGGARQPAAQSRQPRAEGAAAVVAVEELAAPAGLVVAVDGLAHGRADLRCGEKIQEGRQVLENGVQHLGAAAAAKNGLCRRRRRR
ncbi:hypothetical protein DFJ73DRAFT_843136 [Zopfochytrium polystomum]|nr:hypothetical protein DFJ73DRAFT_843136 [Zopfochytrium polystomum]